MTTNLCDVLRAKVAAGLLPAPGRPAQKPQAAAGRNEQCDGCDQLIYPGDFEYDVKTWDLRSMRFHRTCYWAWLRTA
jgi:hypothetical protein